VTTSVDPQILAAIERADEGWLSANVDGTGCPPAVLARLVRHDDVRLRMLGLRWLADRVAVGQVRDLDELSRLLPEYLDGPPEIALAAAGLYQRLWPYVADGSWPRWRSADLPAVVRIAWLRAEIITMPGCLPREPAGEQLYQAVAGLRFADAHDPERLLGELADSGDPVLRAAALRLCQEGLYAALLAPARARDHLVRLLATAAPDVAAGALTELAKPWAALDPFPPERLRRFVVAAVAASSSAVTSEGSAPAVVAAALTAAARYGLRDMLLDAVADHGLAPRLRQHALELLGDLLDRDHIREVTKLAAEDPLLFGRPAVACLLALHRRGLFPAGEEAGAVIALALADHTIPPPDVATILFTARRETLAALLAADLDDPTWPRRLALLVALAEQGTPELAIGAAVAGLLPTATAPEPFLDAIRALRYADAEAAVIAALPRAPAAAIRALEAIGGSQTVAALEQALDGSVAPYLRPVRHRALELCWQLIEEPARRHALLRRLDPGELPARIAADLGRPDERELAVRRAGLKPDRPVEAVVRLARDGDAGTVPAIADVLGRVVAELAIAWQARTSASGERAAGTALDLYGVLADRRGLEPGGPPPAEREPVVPQDAVEAIHDLGRRLHRRGRIRPVHLLDVPTGKAAGDALVAGVALDLLDRPGLSPTEQAILLELLSRAPYAGTRARVHRLLRHRDPHVRKHVIALLARDGHGAKALSATLTPLTGARDVQTVRQALLALGQVGARWASQAIAACLDHPTMNVKKTAAEALRGAGTPAAVPQLLAWLGRHDNPGLRKALVQALRAVLADATAATVLAAAERVETDRTRELLLEALDGDLPTHSVAALVDQGSPVGPALLALVAAGRVALRSGTVDELAARMAAHGVTLPAEGPKAGHRPDPDLVSLVTDGWHARTAGRVAARYDREPGHLPADHLSALRKLLPNWLRLAGTDPAARRPTLRLVLRCCPAPWSADECASFAHSLPVLVAGASDLARDDRDGVIAIIEDVAPRLSAPAAFGLVTQLRGLPPVPAGDRSFLTLLRRCGAVLTRPDVEQALACARLAADPWRAEVDVLREAFTAPQPEPDPQRDPDPDLARKSELDLAGEPERDLAGEPEPASARAWRDSLDAAAREPGAVATLRGEVAPELPSRARLDALIDSYPAAHPDNRGALLSWMMALQPVDAPQWTISEQARRTGPPPRAPRDTDLDQPRSAALRQRLLALLTAPTASQRQRAAEALRGWPEPEIRGRLLGAYLRGDVNPTLTADLARTLAAMDPAELRGDQLTDTGQERAARLAAYLDPTELEPLIPALLHWWEHGVPATRSAAERALRWTPADTLAAALGERLDAGAWGFLHLLGGGPLLRTPALTETCRRLYAEGLDDLADRLTLVPGPLSRTGTVEDAVRADTGVLAALRERPAAPPAAPPATRRELIELARRGDAVQIRAALSLHAEAADNGPAGDGPADGALTDLLDHLLHHPEPRIRLHAHRVSRRLLDRPTYLRHTEILLGDPRPEILRAAIRTVSYAAWLPAIPAVVGLLQHPDPGVRRTASAGLVQFGAPAVPAVTHAAGRARPDKRRIYTDLLTRLSHR